MNTRWIHGDNKYYFIDDVDSKWIHTINGNGNKSKFKIETGLISGAKNSTYDNIDPIEALKLWNEYKGNHV